MMTRETETVGTIWGPFNRYDAERLRTTLREAKEAGLTETQFDGKPLDVGFGTYLLEFVDDRLKDYR